MQAPASGASGPSGSGTPVATGVPVSAGDAIVTVTDVSELTLSADVDETDVLLVRREIKAEAEFDAVPGGVYAAVVTGVGVTPMEGTTGGASYPVQLSLGRGPSTTGAGPRRPNRG
nr:hypothetical protein GCM10020093_081660 [Planobispora longispora]